MSDVRSTLVGALVLSLGVLWAPGAAASSPIPSLSAAGLPVFAPDEPLVLTLRQSDDGGGIFVMRPDGTGLRQLATDILPGIGDHADWSPDGQLVVFVDHATDRLWIAHLDGSPTTAVPACDSPAPYNDPPMPGCDNPAWSPDGTRIAFSRYEGAAGWTLPGPAAVGIRRGRSRHGCGHPGGPPGASPPGRCAALVPRRHPAHDRRRPDG